MRRSMTVITIAFFAALYFFSFLAVRRGIEFSTTHFSAIMYYELPDSCNAIRAGRWDVFLQQARAGAYPPLFKMAASLMAGMFGMDWTMITVVHGTLYFVMALVFIYLIGRRIGDATSGIAAMVLLALYPLTYGTFLSAFPQDFAIMGIMLMSVYLLLRSEFFASTAGSVLLAVSCGWGLMMKDPFFAYIAGPTGYGIYRALREAPRKSYMPLINVALFLAVVAALIYPYYFANIRYVLDRAVLEPSTAPWYAYENLKFFTTGLWMRQLSLPFFILLLAGVWYGRKTIKTPVVLVLALWVVVPNIVQILMPHWKSSRYLLPQLPALALISAAAIRPLLMRPAGKVAILGVLMIGALQYADTVVGREWLPRLRLGPVPYYSGYECRDVFQFKDDMVRTDRELRNIADQMRPKIIEMVKQRVTSTPLLMLVVVLDRGWCYEFDMNLDTLFWFQNLPLRVRRLDHDADSFGEHLRRADMIAVFADRRDSVDLRGLADAQRMKAVMGSRMPPDFDSTWRATSVLLRGPDVVAVSDTVLMHLYTIARNEGNERAVVRLAASKEAALPHPR